MRKKLKMRAGGEVAKYAEGGRVGGQRPTEDRARMAADAAAGFDAEEERALARRAARTQAGTDREAANARAREAWRGGQSAITNQPVGGTPAQSAARPPRGTGPGQQFAEDGMSGMGMGPRPLPTPPRMPRRRAAGRRAPREEVTADDLNARELRRLGVTPLRKGGRVVGKKK